MTSSPTPQGGEPEDYDYRYDDDEAECWNCSGEGFVSNCFEEFACLHPDVGCDDCTRPCDVCRPRKPTEQDLALREVLREALAKSSTTRDGAAVVAAPDGGE